MAKTSEGVLKARANKLGMSLPEYKTKIETDKWCTNCKQFHNLSMFGIDRSRYDGKATSCISSRRVSIRINTKGRTSKMTGHKYSSDVRRNMGNKPGWSNPFKGVPRSTITRKKISETLRVTAVKGKGCHSYKDGRCKDRILARQTSEYKQWRYDVYIRDKFTCQICLDSRGGNLCAHHIFGYADYPNLRLCIANGLTLCKDCHKYIHSKDLLAATARL